MMRNATVATILIALCLSSAAFGQGGPNDGTNTGATLVIDTATGAGNPCLLGPEVSDCSTANPPDITVGAGATTNVFFLINNATNIAAVDVAWDWDDSWIIDPAFTGVTYQECTTNPISISKPQNPGGPIVGRLVTAHDCITASFIRLGRMPFQAGTQGCIEFVEVSDVYGTHVVDCTNERNEYNHVTVDDQKRFGKICVGGGGFDACPPLTTPTPEGACCRPEQPCVIATQADCVTMGGNYLGDGSTCGPPDPCTPNPVEPATWGKIKETYSR